MADLIPLQKLRASSANRWLNCLASALLPPAKGWDNTPSAAAQLGTDMHKQLENALEANDASIIKDQGVEYCFEYVLSKLTEESRVSTELQMFRFFDERVMVSGSCDIMITSGSEVEIIDYKNGAYEISEETAQLAIYAMLLKIQNPFVKKLSATIVQPNLSQGSALVKSRVVSKKETDNLKKEIEALLEKRDLTETVGEWCKFCPRTACCAAYLKEHGGDMRELATADSGNRGIEQLADDELAGYIDLAYDVADLIKILKDEGKDRLIDGREISGYKLGQRSKKEEFVPGSQGKIIVSLSRRISKRHEAGDKEGVNELLPALSLASPNTVREAVPDADLEELIRKPEGKTKFLMKAKR